MATSDDLPPTDSGTESPDALTKSLHELETRLAKLNDRIQGIEDSVTDDASHWEKDFDDKE